MCHRHCDFSLSANDVHGHLTLASKCSKEPVGRLVFPILTYPSAFRMISNMKTMSQVGLNKRVPVPPEKRFLIHGDNLLLALAKIRRSPALAKAIAERMDRFPITAQNVAKYVDAMAFQ